MPLLGGFDLDDEDGRCERSCRKQKIVEEMIVSKFDVRSLGYGGFDKIALNAKNLTVAL